MSQNALTKVKKALPTMLDDFFKPWNELFDSDHVFLRTLTVPSVNITEEKDCYKADIAAPGMQKEDFKIDLEGNILTISAEKEEEKEENGKKYTRKEYNYSSFSRSFTLPNEVKKESIEAKYNNGVLQLLLPKKEDVKNQDVKKIAVN